MSTPTGPGSAPAGFPTIPVGPDLPTTSYWYDPEDPGIALLHAVRRFRRADQEMRRAMGEHMELNATDIEALRHVISRERTGSPLTARDLTASLHISTASTAKLLNRLSESGHIRRLPHPQDRRSVIVEATDHAHAEVRGWLSPMHQRMLEAAHGVPEESRQAVVDFLEAMADALAPQPSAESAGRPRSV